MSSARLASGRNRPAARRRVKIVATVGPASSDPKVLARMIGAGMNVARLNMSHGTYEEHERTIASIRAIDRHVGILLDLSGPKLRTGRNAGGGTIRLVPGARVLLTSRRVLSTAERISVGYPRLTSDLRVGGRVLLDDGHFELDVIEVSKEGVLCRVEEGGELGEHKGVHLPGERVSAPSMTAKDRRDLAFGLEHGVDMVALSFVRRAADVRTVERLVHRTHPDVPVFAKLETSAAVDDLDAILEVADGVMVARGDLGLDLAPELVPLAQKRIIRAANLAGRPVITATQMLDSMTTKRRPTRAEATDVANAVVDGTDAVMLSGETAIGVDPPHVVRMMARIALATESHEVCGPHLDRLSRSESWRRHGLRVHSATAQAATDLARDTDARVLAVHTRSGRTARLVARERPGVPIYALTQSAAIVRALSIVWGVEALILEQARTTDRMIVDGERALVDAELVDKGDLLVSVAGAIGLKGGSRSIKLMRVGDDTV